MVRVLISLLVSGNMPAYKSSLQSVKNAISSALPEIGCKFTIATVINTLNEPFRAEVIKLRRDAGHLLVNSRSSNGGPGKGHNAVIRHFRSHLDEYDYCMMIDGDDILYPNSLNLIFNNASGIKSQIPRPDLLMLMINDHISATDQEAFHVFIPPSTYFYTAMHEQNWWNPTGDAGTPGGTADESVAVSTTTSLPPPPAPGLANPFTHSIHQCKTPARMLLMSAEMFRTPEVCEKFVYDEECLLYDDFGIVVRAWELHRDRKLRAMCLSNTDLYAYNSINDDSATRTFRRETFIHQDNIGFLSKFDSRCTDASTAADLDELRKTPVYSDEKWTQLYRNIPHLKLGLTTSIYDKINYYIQMIVLPAVEHALETRDMHLARKYYYHIPQTFPEWNKLHQMLYGASELVNIADPSRHVKKIAILNIKNNIDDIDVITWQHAIELAKPRAGSQTGAGAGAVDIYYFTQIPSFFQMPENMPNLHLMSLGDFSHHFKADVLIICRYIVGLMVINRANYDRVYYWMLDAFFNNFGISTQLPNSGIHLVNNINNFKPRYIDRIICTSHHHRNIQRYIRLDPDILGRMSMIYHGVPDDVFDLAKSVKKEPYTFGYIHTTGTSIDKLVEMWPKIRQGLGDKGKLKLFMFGELEEADKFIQMGIEMVNLTTISSTKGGDHELKLPTMRQIAELLAPIATYIDPSDNYGIGMWQYTLALAVGCLVLTQYTGGADEIVSKYGGAALRGLDVGQVVGIVQAHQGLGADGQRLESLRKYYSYSCQINTWMEILNSELPLGA